MNLSIGLICLRIGTNCLFFCECLMNIPTIVRKFCLSEIIFAIHAGLCCTLGNSRPDGSWERSLIVASVLRAAWPRNCGSDAGKWINFDVSTTSGLCLRSSQLHVHVAHGVRCLWQEGNLPCLSSTKMNVWIRSSISPIWLHFMAQDSAQGRLCTVFTNWK